jgi:hypothetical protein
MVIISTTTTTIHHIPVDTTRPPNVDEPWTYGVLVSTWDDEHDDHDDDDDDRIQSLDDTEYDLSQTELVE